MPIETVTIGESVLYLGDCRDVLPTLPDASVDSVVTDPPYELGFMGAAWDASGIAYNVAMWREVCRVLKPGGHLLAFGGTRTYHRMTCAIEDAGFEIRDCIQWIYGSGFPKSANVSKMIDKAAGAEREVVGRGENYGRTRLADGKTAFGDYAGEWDVTAPATPDAERWQGWGTALKPANEPIVVARKPLGEKTVAANVLKHGTGAINIDGCRVDSGGTHGSAKSAGTGSGRPSQSGVPFVGGIVSAPHEGGRWPANVIHDGSDEVLEAFAAFGEKAVPGPYRQSTKSSPGYSGGWGAVTGMTTKDYGDTGTAARFFYCAKASRSERGADNRHPTVKPLALARYLVRLVTPPGGTVLTPFLGSGTEIVGAALEGFSGIGIEIDPTYFETACRRIRLAAQDQRSQLPLEVA